MKPLRQHKYVGIAASLRYGLRLTLRHLRTLVPVSALFYLPELAERLGIHFPGGRVAVTLFKFMVGCWLVWHALRLGDQETRTIRFKEAVLPAPGYLARFLGSTLLFWGTLGLALWPVSRLASGTWGLNVQGWDWLKSPWIWTAAQAWGALAVGVSALPAGLWSVYGWFHGYYVADEGQGPLRSMVSSFRAVQGAFWPCVLFLMVIAALNAAGLALWVVGVFFTFPVTLMATTYIHMELKRQTQDPGELL